jgi:tryptophan halogenase
MKTDSIVVLGGGSAGWMTATTLKKTFPEKNISVIESKDVPIVGVGESTIGGIRKWAQWIGLKEESFFPKTDATIKMSIKFTDFYKKDSGSFHYPFGKAIQEGERNPFSDWAMKKYFYPNTPIEDLVRSLFPAAALFESNKYSENLEYEFDNFNPDNDIAYHFDATKFGIWLRDEFCIPNGVTHIVGTVVSTTQDEDGITGLILEDGTTVTADLYVDCTGFKSLLLEKTLEQPFESYEHLLPNNRAWATRIGYKDKERELEGFTNCTAIENGWCWNIPLWSRLGAGYVYSDKFVSPEQAQEEFKKYLMSEKMVIPRTQEEVDALTFNDVKMRVGIHTETFVKNVVAIGLSAGFIEPLESNGLYSVHEFLFKLTDILRRSNISQFDRDMYNTSVRRMFDEFTKFVAMHYGLSHRDDTPYWKSVQNTKLSDRFGDPYFPYVGRQDAFAQMGRRYMELWYHPLDMSGIPFISTGMQLNMLNEYRFLNIQKANPLVNFSHETNEIYSRWGERQRRWAANAEKAPTMTQYLQERFYKENENE